MAASSGAIQRSKSARGHGLFDTDRAGLEPERRRLRRRQRLLQPRDRLVEAIAVVVVEDLDQAGDLFRLQRRAHQAADIAHVPRGAHQGQLLPAGEGGVVAVGDRQDVVEGACSSTLAELRRDQVVDDPVVEGVAGHAHAGRWPGARRGSRRLAARSGRWRSRWCRRRSRPPAPWRRRRASGRRRRPPPPAR